MDEPDKSGTVSDSYRLKHLTAEQARREWRPKAYKSGDPHAAQVQKRKKTRWKQKKLREGGRKDENRIMQRVLLERPSPLS